MLPSERAEQFLLDQARKQDVSPYFHDELKGCQLEKFVKYSSKFPYYNPVNRYLCHKHDVEVCKCGWQVGHHGGAENNQQGSHRAWEDAVIVFGRWTENGVKNDGPVRE